jgi:adenylylsulfate kinase
MTVREPAKGFALWFTGLPASGKSSVANRTAELLEGHGLRVHVLDSDDLRRVLTPSPTYDEEERRWFYAVMAYIGALLADHGVNVLFAATAHRQAYRNRARNRIDRFAEVHVKCSLETCRRRDPEGLYARAAQGRIDNLPGVQSPYEAPQEPDLVVDTERHDPAACAAQVLRFLQNGLIDAENRRGSLNP